MDYSDYSAGLDYNYSDINNTRDYYYSGFPGGAMPGFLTLLVGISVSAILGNSLVIIAIVVSKRLHDAPSYLLLSLAVTDLLTGAVCIPVTMINLMRDQSLSDAVCSMNKRLGIVLFLVSVLHLIAINTERYIALSRPLHYPTIVTTPRIILLVITIWVIGVVPTAVYLTVSNTAEDYCMTNLLYGWRIFLFLMVFYFLIPFVIACTIYVKIYKLAKRHIEALAELSVTSQRSDTTSQQLGQTSQKPGNTSQQRKQKSLPSKQGTKPAAGNTLPMRGHVNDEECCVTRKHVAGSQHENQSNTNNDEQAQSKLVREQNIAKANMKLTKMIAFVVGGFGICTGPSLLIRFAIRLYWSMGYTSLTLKILDVIAWDVGWFNCVLNPIIYALCTRKFRKVFRRIITCGRRHETTENTA